MADIFSDAVVGDASSTSEGTVLESSVVTTTTQLTTFNIYCEEGDTFKDTTVKMLISTRSNSADADFRVYRTLNGSELVNLQAEVGVHVKLKAYFRNPTGASVNTDKIQATSSTGNSTPS